MESLYLLIPISVGLVFGALWLFFKASDDGQFDDLVGPAIRVLHHGKKFVDARDEALAWRRVAQ